MSRVRMRRLTADHKRITQAFAGSPFIRVVQVTGAPPDRYQIEYAITGLEIRGERVIKRKRHLAEIYLTTGYPRQAPQCRMLTPCFHPNIDPKAICVGDHWAAGESLAHLILRIGELIAYQSYNTKSPLNGEAARWADEHRRLLPIDPADLVPERLADIESAAIHVAVPKPQLKPSSQPGVLKAKVLKAKVLKAKAVAPKKAKILKARKVAPTGSAAGTAPSAGPFVVNCPCGRRFKIKQPKSFRCFGCGQPLSTED